MTEKEKETIRKAIHLIHTKDDYYGGMNILWELVGEKPIDLGNVKNTSIKDIHNGPEGPFKANI